MNTSNKRVELKTKKCRYCGNEYDARTSKTMCAKCKRKAHALPRFAKARDDLRKRLGLRPLNGAPLEKKGGVIKWMNI